MVQVLLKDHITLKRVHFNGAVSVTQGLIYKPEEFVILVPDFNYAKHDKALKTLSGDWILKHFPF